jgi:cyclophilin family peptidyl-prolyl cis-trans isomerase
MKTGLLTIVCLLTGAFLTSAGQPIARFQSVLGDFDVLLDPVAAPQSVENFSAYANRSAYDRSIIHRSTTYNPLTIQIVQGGGFQLVTTNLFSVPTDPSIPLEARLANTRGTLAMARGNEPDSATSQWYFNVSDNPGLDFNYAVFGRVMGSGQNIVEAIGTTPVYDATPNLGGAFAELPLFAPDLTEQSLVLINTVRVEPFAITNFTRGPDWTEIRWTQLSTNSPVRIERTTSLVGPWETVSSNNTSGVFNDTAPPSGGAFYRVVTE